MRKFTIITVLLLLSACVSAQTAGENSPSIKKAESEHRYPFFGFSITIPESWYVQEPEKISNTPGSDTEQVLIAFRDQRSAPGVCNPNIACMTEKISADEGIKYGIDYLESVKSLITAAHGEAQYNFDQTPSKERIDGLSFDVLTAKIAVMNGTITQRFYSTIIKGYAFTFILSFSNTEEEKGLREVLSSAKFDKDAIVPVKKNGASKENKG
jgi:hypothetical protein